MALTFKQIPLSQINLEGTKANPNFEANLESYLEKLQNRLNQDETNKVANTLQQFFTDLGFSADSQHKQSGAKGNSNIDLALLKNGDVKVIIEAKKKNNTKEMFSPTNLNCRALHECVLYYLRERDSSLLTPNTSLSFIIITDFHKFYIFKSSEFRRIFEKSKPIQELYKNFSDKKNIFASKATNQDFYDELSKIIDSKNFLDSIDRDGDLSSIDLEGFHFDLSKINEKDLKTIARILSPEFLYNERSIDPNALNERFYLELLHILGT